MLYYLENNLMSTDKAVKAHTLTLHLQISLSSNSCHYIYTYTLMIFRYIDNIRYLYIKEYILIRYLYIIYNIIQ